jgi:RimJ/RimL family protein N-acetyltransferase
MARKPMIARDLKVSNELSLIAPNVDRDAILSLNWMNGESGHETQRLMGIAPQDIQDHTLDQEQKLIESFIDTDEEIVWMIRYHEKIIGAVEVRLHATDHEKAPTISIMIGDPGYRGKEIGREVMKAVVDYLHNEKSYNEVYARYLTSNAASRKMNEHLGFKLDEKSYIDEDGLEWQNVKYEWTS